MKIITASMLKALIEGGRINISKMERDHGVNRRSVYNFIKDANKSKLETVIKITRAVNDQIKENEQVK